MALPSISLTQLLTFSALGLLAILTFILVRALYNITLHPLTRFPGPTLWAASRLPWVTHQFRSDLVQHLATLHAIYGSVVRIAPDELSFIDPTAFKDIHSLPSKSQLPRDPYIFPPELPELPGGLIYADNIQHPRMRRQIAYAFSQRALEEQAGLIQGHVDVLVRQFRDAATNFKTLNVADWFNFASFDIIAHLAYGEPFGCLESGEYHPYAAFVLEAFKGGIFASAFNRYGLLKFAMHLIPKEMARKRAEFIEMGRALLDKRLAQQTEIEEKGSDQRPDFVSYMLGADKKDVSMTYSEMAVNTVVFIIAGSESTATLLTGTMLYLLKDAGRMAKVTEEVRKAFEKEEDINISSVSKLSYMLACLEEGLRITTPAPFGMARRTAEPMTIAEVQVPKGVSVSVPQFAAWHSDTNFTRPNEFIPERWLERENANGEFASDRKANFVPFGVGPRNCIGKNLAYVEMRLILSRLLWNFDFELMDQTFDWSKQKAFIVWEKEPVMVKAKLAR